MATPQPPTRRGQEFATKADIALREGKVEEAKTWHKNAWNAFKEARDALVEGDTNTKMALKILIDYHRFREKNPGDPKNVHVRQDRTAKPSPPPEGSPTVGQSTSSSTSSLPEAWSAVAEVGDTLQNSLTPPPLPEFTPVTRSVSANAEWKKGNQSVMMAESFLLVGGETLPSTGHISSNGTTKEQGKSMGISSPDRGMSQHRTLSSEVDRLTKEVVQLRTLIAKEREEAKQQKERFWKMFVLVKTALEESNHESDLKALTRLLHAETEARKKAEAELAALRRSFS